MRFVEYPSHAVLRLPEAPVIEALRFAETLTSPVLNAPDALTSAAFRLPDAPVIEEFTLLETLINALFA